LPKSDLDSNFMHGSAGPEDRFPPVSAEDAIPGAKASSTDDAFHDPSRGGGALAETELDSALQLLVERAQYITGATGTALALPQGEEMVCRASAGSCAPAVGARLQVQSGLTGESISRRQLLRCDNAETDPRVNLEACRALGIASIVVLPLLRRDGEVRGLFELFSDHPYAFEERDLIALERMAGLTLTALDLAEDREDSPHSPASMRAPEKPVESPTVGDAREDAASPLQTEFADSPTLPAELPEDQQPAPASVPDAMLRVQKCAFCGFPVSEGRTLCLDCEKKDCEKKDSEKPQRVPEQDTPSASAANPEAPTAEEFVPAFLANPASAPESWLANHINLLAIVVLILGIVVVVVVFR
jgi:putative methionine-R-sulfoxide reductase with GAF domain